MLDIVPEMMELDIDVLGARAHLWDLGNFEGTTVVFEDAAVNHWLGGDHVEPLALELFD